jgi:hypothetical protein
MALLRALSTILCDTRAMLVDAYNGCIEQLRGIVIRRQAIHDPRRT